MPLVIDHGLDYEEHGDAASCGGDGTQVYAPASPQQHVDQQADEWAAQWAVGGDLPAPCSPPLAAPPPAPTVRELITAIRSFPAGTAFGSDQYHPRLLLRLDSRLLSALLKVLVLCEIIGAWPTVITDVLIALLPKSSGGLRPIGIFPTLIRVWFRLRAPVIRAWERAHERPYFFAGCGKGADVALWLQAAHLESAALAKRASAASLVDLVKAFERVSHVALLDAALRWDYPIWILRLSLAAYRLARRISINGILSGALLALRGITAGSVFATTELRLLLLVALDDVAAAFPELPLHVYVDDMFLAVVGAPRHVCRVLTDATVLLVPGLTAALLEESHTKSEGIA